MSLSEKAIKEYQAIYKKEFGKEISHADAADGGERLVRIFKLLFDGHVEEMKRQEKLKEFPKGYSLMDGKTYNCRICHQYISNEQLWYDKWGMKCLACQDAVNKKIIPGKACRDDKSWYASWELQSSFMMHATTVRKLVRNGVLKAREVPKTGFQVFLLKENADTLPPKEFVKYVSIPDKDNKMRHTMTPWYDVYDPEKVLKNYHILPHLKTLREYTPKP